MSACQAGHPIVVTGANGPDPENEARGNDERPLYVRRGLARFGCTVPRCLGYTEVRVRTW